MAGEVFLSGGFLVDSEGLRIDAIGGGGLSAADVDALFTQDGIIPSGSEVEPFQVVYGLGTVVLVNGVMVKDGVFLHLLGTDYEGQGVDITADLDALVSEDEEVTAVVAVTWTEGSTVLTPAVWDATGDPPEPVQSVAAVVLPQAEHDPAEWTIVDSRDAEDYAILIQPPTAITPADVDALFTQDGIIPDPAFGGDPFAVALAGDVIGLLDGVMVQDGVFLHLATEEGYTDITADLDALVSEDEDVSAYVGVTWTEGSTVLTPFVETGPPDEPYALVAGLVLPQAEHDPAEWGITDLRGVGEGSAHYAVLIQPPIEFVITEAEMAAAEAGLSQRVTYDPLDDATITVDIAGIERLIIEVWPERTVQPGVWEAETAFAGGELIAGGDYVWEAAGPLTSGLTVPDWSATPITEANQYQYGQLTVADGDGAWQIFAGGSITYPNLALDGTEAQINKPFALIVAPKAMNGDLTIADMLLSTAPTTHLGGRFSWIGLPTTLGGPLVIYTPMMNRFSGGAVISGYFTDTIVAGVEFCANAWEPGSIPISP
jgi:hypothetical protein